VIPVLMLIANVFSKLHHQRSVRSGWESGRIAENLAYAAEGFAHFLAKASKREGAARESGTALARPSIDTVVGMLEGCLNR